MTNKKSVKVSIDDHKWLMKRKVDLGYKSVEELVGVIIAREKALEEAQKRGNAGQQQN
jgi:hypothetical protein